MLLAALCTNTRSLSVFPPRRLPLSTPSLLQRLLEGADFYAAPRSSSSGDYLVWEQWYHPDLPFQSAEIKVAKVVLTVDGKGLAVESQIHVAGQKEAVSVQDPNWAANDCIIFTSDISGYQNPWAYKFENGDVATSHASPILQSPIEEECGLPRWWLSRHGLSGLSEYLV
ncbi:hypothetical protein E1B28_012645 [Marasmius oreades]|uniref:Uncharacterized protein n=1 Tax=Marasmius oreades TaxID=181124 RepID=A0A9P7RSM4_9AGAR|nr:uncharacterized protein E1B28_012645 [Marasmius oreades]KAG7088673.1 hypothetical protein E1B28_012645 [Marasmius oreades]